MESPHQQVAFDPGPLSDIGDAELEAAVVALFLEDSAVRLPELLGAIDAGDPGRLDSLAHGLKGSAASVGAVRVSELCAELCAVAADGVSSAAAQIHAQLTDALSEVAIAMHAYLGAAA